MQRYVAWSLGYAFPELTNFFAKLEDLILKVTVTTAGACVRLVFPFFLPFQAFATAAWP